MSHKEKLLMKKDIFGFVGVMVLILGIFILIPRYSDFSNFPLSLTPLSLLGILLVIAGMTGIYYATR